MSTTYKEHCPKVVLFDLDDTLFDHRFSSRRGLGAVRDHFSILRAVPSVRIEREYRRLLTAPSSASSPPVLADGNTREARFAALFVALGCDVRSNAAQRAAAIYREAYDAEYRPVRGSGALLSRLHTDVQIILVTNNSASVATWRLKRIGLQRYVARIISGEDIGSPKPSPNILVNALRELSCIPKRSVMIGDSWTIDVIPATTVGMRAIWLNRYGDPTPRQPRVDEIRSLLPTNNVVHLIMNGQR